MNRGFVLIEVAPKKYRWFIWCLVFLILAGTSLWAYTYITGLNIETNNTFILDTVRKKTASWKTYTNEKYNYKIKYPKYWIVESDKNSKNVVINNIEESENSVIIDVYSSQEELPKNAENLNLDLWLREQVQNGEFKNLKDVYVNNIKGQQVEEVVSQKKVITTVYVNNDNMIYRIKNIASEYFDQMISTFEFIE